MTRRRLYFHIHRDKDRQSLGDTRLFTSLPVAPSIYLTDGQRRTDGGQTDNERTGDDGRTNERTDGRMTGRPDGQMTDERMTDGWMTEDGRTDDGRTDG